MKQQPALGLVETRGLVGAIEAADAMCKAANVKLLGREKTNPALITITIIGETAAVKTAVEAGAAAASRVGELVSTLVIPRPDLQLDSLLSGAAEETETGN
ncbi:BMC domain-containing protein [Ignavibacteriales bacterium]